MGRRRFHRATLGAGLVVLVALGLAPAGAGAQSGQLNIGLAAEPSTLDPHLSGEIPAHNIARNVYDTLLLRDEGMRLAPSLAESWRLVSPTTYQFKLRRGVKFHNGEPFNAAAVKFSIERQLNHPKSRAKAALAPVERVEVVDEYTVNVVSKSAFPVFLARNTYAGSGSVVMLPPKYVQEKGDDAVAAQPVGTGPFRFVEWVKGDRVTLEANPDYWRARPRVQRVTFRFIPETATRIASLLNGETDIVENVPPDQVERVASNPATTIGKTSDGMIVVYYQFDTRLDSPVKNRKVREAINHAIDWDTIVRDLLRGHARRRPVPLDPGDGVNPGLKTFAYDPEKAKRLLAEAGHPNGFSFTMPTSSGRYMQDRAVSEAVAAYLGKVGIKATVQPAEWGVYLKSLAEKRTGPVFVIGWGSGLFDSDVLVDEFGCKVTYATYCNEQVEDLLQKARAEGSPEARTRLYHRAQELLIEDAAFAGAYQPAALFGIGKRVDWKPTIGELIFLWNAGIR